MAIIKLNNNSISAVTALPAGVGGKVLQIVGSTTSTTTSTTSSSYVSTNLTANITPSSSSNKILIHILGGQCDTDANGQVFGFSIFRGSTNLGNATHGHGEVYGASSRLQTAVTTGFLDSPSSTSEITYTLKIRASSGTTYFCRNASVASIVLMEIEG